MPEDCLLTGPLESTNEAYALAKISGLKMCQHYRSQYGVTYHSAMPTNLYGPGDNYHPDQFARDAGTDPTFSRSGKNWGRASRDLGDRYATTRVLARG